MPDIKEEDLIKGCLKRDRNFQQALYKRYAAKMLVVCSRYVNKRDDAEDILQEGFITVFEKLDQFRSEGSLEGWIRRVMVNKSIEHYRKATKMYTTVNIDNTPDYEFLSSEDIISNISSKELLELVQELTPVYRMIFNLYVFEGMKHKEIARQLGIAEGTSKSNLSDARAVLQRKVKRLMGSAATKENVG
jgi:RNA polymerase sigma-70 factor (ECF subfamily)